MLIRILSLRIKSLQMPLKKKCFNAYFLLHSKLNCVVTGLRTVNILEFCNNVPQGYEYIFLDRGMRSSIASFHNITQGQVIMDV